jgi:hypothetical protein
MAKVLKSRGISKKTQGIPKSSLPEKADDLKRHQPTMDNVGIGSAHTLAKLRLDAARVRAEKKIPGNLGYQINLGPGKEHAKSVQGKKKEKK